MEILIWLFGGIVAIVWISVQAKRRNRVGKGLLINICVGVVAVCFTASASANAMDAVTVTRLLQAAIGGALMGVLLNGMTLVIMHANPK